VLFSFYCLKNELDGLPVPRTWLDLTDPKYRGKVVIPALNLPVIPDFLAALYYYFGDSLFINFCRNVSFAMHPAVSSPRKKRENPGAIFVAPLHFAKIMRSDDSEHVLPEDGFVTVPAFVAQTAENNDDVAAIARHLVSREWLDPYFKFGSFIPNHRDIAVDVPLDRLICRPWSSLIDMVPDQLLRQLLRHFKLETAV
jgi:ABC-type Fe3+ transport system substrate-binding protein